jgi:hypothetical protein
MYCSLITAYRLADWTAWIETIFTSFEVSDRPVRGDALGDRADGNLMCSIDAESKYKRHTGGAVSRSVRNRLVAGLGLDSGSSPE